jgi:hypothetical protein
VGDEQRQCGMCQLTKRNGVFSDDGTVCICDQCNQFTVDLHKMQDGIRGDDPSPDSN